MIILFVPVYNEAEKLGDVLKQIPTNILDQPVELVIVDDYSSDNSVAIASQFTSHIIRLASHSGVGVATKIGFVYIAKNFEEGCVIKFDGDGQHDLQLLPKVAQQLQLHDVVVCSRFHPDSDQTYTPIDRLLLNGIFTEMVKRITGWHVTDVRSGFMGFHLKDIRSFTDDIIVQRYGIPMELLLRLWHKRENASLVEIAQPAMYGRGISHKLNVKYSTEQLSDKSDRLQMAYIALLEIVKSLDISKEKLLESRKE